MTAQTVSEKLPTKKTPTVQTSQWWRRLTDRRYLPTVGTVATLILLLVVGQLRYSTDDRSFISARLFSNLFIDNSYLLVLAIGMTFVIISGGIDLSVGGVVADGSRRREAARRRRPAAARARPRRPRRDDDRDAHRGGDGPVLQDPTVHRLAGGGLFLARGLANMIGTTAIGIKDEGFASLASWKIKFGEKPDIWYVNLSMIIALVVLLAAVYLLHYTRFGRTVYGLGAGDNGQAAGLMGLRPGATKMWVYVISGTCAGIGGLLFAFYTKSGYNLSGVGMELDAIASVVIGGALLSGASATCSARSRASPCTASS